MEPQEMVLSDVHLQTDNLNVLASPSKLEDDQMSLNDDLEHSSDLQVVFSRFPFTLIKSKADNKSDEISQLHFDEDGDLSVVRKHKASQELLVIEHTLATPLALVGLQVWNGALLLSDFLLNIGEELKDVVALELGSGIGLCTIILSLFAKTVFCTDVGDKILELCQRNISRNCGTLKENATSDVNVFVRELDWWQTHPFDNSGKFQWLPEDRKIAEKATVYIASDVIYDDDLTDAFFETIQQLFNNRSGCILYLSLEKRLNFTLKEMDIAAPAYLHFEKKLHHLTVVEKPKVKFMVKRLDTSFPKCFFHYERTKYLELWEIRTV